MSSETRTCQNCKENFSIEPDDFSFYKKLKVPPPTWCPHCRFIRKMTFVNERSLYKRICGNCNASIISMYNSDTSIPVWCVKCHISDVWDARDYAREYDFSRNFFEQFKELKYITPHRALDQNERNGTGCEYANYCFTSKNIYLSFFAHRSENIKYSRSFLKNNKNCMDSLVIQNNDRGYELVQASSNYNSSFLIESDQCIDSHFLYDCSNCVNCCMSSNLRNKSNVFGNKQYSKEEYEEMLSKIIKHMNDMPYTDKMGRKYSFGEYFPTELSPFAYNETVAFEEEPMTKEEIISKGYKWREPEKKSYVPTIKTEELPDSIKDIADTITDEVIECQNEGKTETQCTSAFRILPDELAFYRQMNLPIPRYCPNCRYHQRLIWKNPFRFYERECMCELSNHNHEGKCKNNFETMYAPDREELIYCKECYQQEIF